MFFSVIKLNNAVECLPGFCLGENGEDVNHGYVHLPGDFTEHECLTKCKKTRGEVGHQMKACEWKSNMDCIYHTLPVKKANDNPEYTCCIFNGGKFIFIFLLKPQII